MATHSSILARRIPWTEEPDRLQSMGLQRVRHDWATKHTHSAFLRLQLKKKENLTFPLSYSWSCQNRGTSYFWWNIRVLIPQTCLEGQIQDVSPSHPRLSSPLISGCLPMHIFFRCPLSHTQSGKGYQFPGQNSAQSLCCIHNMPPKFKKIKSILFSFSICWKLGSSVSWAWDFI